MKHCEGIVEDSKLLLNQGIVLVSEIPPSTYVCKEVAHHPYSIGEQMRHIVDFYEALFKGIAVGEADFAHRTRNLEVEHSPQYARHCLLNITYKLDALKQHEAALPLTVHEELSKGCVRSVSSTLEGTLMLLHTHTLHHYGIIDPLAKKLEYVHPDASFGYNPSTLTYKNQ